MPGTLPGAERRSGESQILTPRKSAGTRLQVRLEEPESLVEPPRDLGEKVGGRGVAIAGRSIDRGARRGTQSRVARGERFDTEEVSGLVDGRLGKT